MKHRRRSVSWRWRPLIGELNKLASVVRQAADRNHLRWEKWEIEALAEIYPHFTNDELAEAFGRSPRAIKVQGGSKGLGLKKTPATVDRARKTASGRAAATRFKRGDMPNTWLPIGTVRRSRDGYLKRKVSDRRDIPSRFNWKWLHVLEWEKHQGPVPEGFNVVFRNGDADDIRIENLELISDADLMRRNTRHRYPEEINRLITAKSVLTRKINSRSKELNGTRR